MSYLEQVQQLVGEPSTHALAAVLFWVVFRLELMNHRVKNHGRRLRRVEEELELVPRARHGMAQR